MKKVFAVLLALLCIVAAAQTTSPQLEQLQRDLREQQRVRDLSNARAGSLENSIKGLNARERSLNATITTLNARLAKLERDRASTQKQLAQTEDKSQSLSLEIKLLEAKIAYGKEQLSILIKTLDKDRSKRYVRLMVRADNAFDLAVKARDLDAIQDVNLNVIDELNINVALLSSKNREYLGVIAKLNQYQRLLETKKTEISRNKQQLSATITDLKKTRVGQQALQLQAIRSAQAASANASSIYSSLISEKNRLAEIRRQRAIEAERKRREEARRKAEEAARIARIRDQRARERAAELERQRQAQAAARIAQATPIQLPNNVGQFLFPMPGGSIYADFGSEGNDYMSIRGASGAAVQAAADGTVVGVETIGSNYGYYVLIAHTNDLDSLVTIYGNLQYPNVAAGQDVRRGQIIGNVGGGALFSDNELHFHVVRNRVYVNPRPYL
jgi:septal ring factor EnvC (AmiA/AmiB activator)